ncbi:MAG: hypothetical protein ACOYOF_21200, partial [Verrucomicrobiaceae bacterium]
MRTSTLPSIGGVLLGAFLLQLPAQAGAAERWLNLFDNKTSFLAATNSPVRADIARAVVTGGSRTFTRNDFRFESGPRCIGFRLADYHAGLPGQEMVLDGYEDFNVLSLKGPMNVFGFDVIELQNHAARNATFVKSTFTVTLKYGQLTVTSFTFSRSTDSA